MTNVWIESCVVMISVIMIGHLAATALVVDARAVSLDALLPQRRPPRARVHLASSHSSHHYMTTPQR